MQVFFYLLNGYAHLLERMHSRLVYSYFQRYVGWLDACLQKA